MIPLEHLPKRNSALAPPIRRKILLVTPSLGSGGAERVFTSLLNHLDRASFDLHLCVLQEQGEYMSDLARDVAVHRLNAPRVRHAIPGLVRLVRWLRPNTILSTHGHLNIALLLSQIFMPSGTRIVLREAAIQSVALDQETRHPLLYKWLYRRLYKRATMVVCLSDSMVDDMAEHFNVPREKLVRIYNPIDVQRVRELAECGKNPYSGPGPHLVAAGRLTRQKGFDVLMEALPSVLQRFPNARLTVLGQGPSQQELTEQIKRLKIERAVSLLGFQTNPWPYVRYADLFVFPSRYEGTPNVVLEALALGRRVIASNCPGGIREIAEGNEAVVLVRPEDSLALAQALISECDRLANHEYPPVHDSSLSRFDLAKIVEEYSRIL